MVVNETSTPGQRLRFLRQARGMKQTELARLSFVTQPAVSQWENDTKTPQLSRQRIIAEALGVNRAFIWGEVPEGAVA